LVKGGHIEAAQSIDYLVTPRGVRAYPAERIQTKNTHGTGCTYSAALATWLARGLPLEDAVERAKEYVTQAIRHGLEIGHGHGPTDHFWFMRGGDRGALE
jgi:hydroxymethylpyrimidine/phosphomethylpyrimidine kinase